MLPKKLLDLKKAFQYYAVHTGPSFIVTLSPIFRLFTTLITAIFLITYFLDSDEELWDKAYEEFWGEVWECLEEIKKWFRKGSKKENSLDEESPEKLPSEEGSSKE